MEDNCSNRLQASSVRINLFLHPSHHKRYELAYKSGYFSLGPWGASLPEPIVLSDQSALSVGFTNDNRKGRGWTVETQAGLSDSLISADWGTRLLGLKVKIGASASSNGEITGFVDGERKITATVRGGVSVSAEWEGGIIMRLRLVPQILS